MLNERLILKMEEFDGGVPQRIQHFVKVYTYAHVIGVAEKIDEKTLKILDMASILHDIGIGPALTKYGRCTGKLQEEEGPAYARELLKEFEDVTEDEVERVCYLIAHHHTYEGVDDMDYRILLEADYLVNSFENEQSKEAIVAFRDRVFRTETGIRMLNTMYGLS